MAKRHERRRVWKFGKQAAFSCYSRTKQEIKKAENENQGLSTKKIQKILNCCRSFAGCFARDELSNLSLQSFPMSSQTNGPSLSSFACFPNLPKGSSSHHPDTFKTQNLYFGFNQDSCNKYKPTPVWSK